MWYNVKAIYNSKPKGKFIMKKNYFKTTLAGIMVAAMCINLTACGINEKVDDKKEISDSTNVTDEKAETANEIKTASESVDFQTELTNNSLFDYELLVNGTVLKLPMTVNQLSQMGYVIERGGYNLEPGECSKGINLYKHSETGVLVNFGYIENEGDTKQHAKKNPDSDTVILKELSFSEGDNCEVNFDGSLIGGIKLSKSATSTADDLIAAFGEPDEIDKKTNHYIYYEHPESDSEEKNFVSFKISENDNIIMQIIMCNAYTE